jgi:hypothetical protein
MIFLELGAGAVRFVEWFDVGFIKSNNQSISFVTMQMNESELPLHPLSRRTVWHYDVSHQLSLVILPSCNIFSPIEAWQNKNAATLPSPVSRYSLPHISQFLKHQSIEWRMPFSGQSNAMIVFQYSSRGIICGTHRLSLTCTIRLQDNQCI